ncbi:hypothetical protein HORIV_36130 [Vreelandella olivaria]|uniref:Uncharacterized protein n=1 Tax=Vreelandella olivaria TaxID=390919 RepID=A0ABM7GKL9_9GAMM|nr:hypothetical protein HORIV_36130 [Halomonas olivaria]
MLSMKPTAGAGCAAGGLAVTRCAGATHVGLARAGTRPLFTNSELVALGKLPLQLTGVMIVLDAAALVLAQALMGAGAQRTVMLLTLGMQWLLLPMAWWVGIGLNQGLLGIWLMQLLYRLINSAGFLWVWQRRRWLAPAF